jgi:hypothetical protein
MAHSAPTAGAKEERKSEGQKQDTRARGWYRCALSQPDPSVSAPLSALTVTRVAVTFCVCAVPDSSDQRFYEEEALLFGALLLDDAGEIGKHYVSVSLPHSLATPLTV